MQAHIPRINESNKDRILEEVLQSCDRYAVIEIMRDVVTQMPHKSRLLSSFANELATRDPGMAPLIKEMVDGIMLGSNIGDIISASYFASCLGHPNFPWTQDILLSGTSAFSAFASPEEETLEECLRAVREIDEACREAMVYTTYIIKNFRFSVQEALNQLRMVSDFSAVVASIKRLSKSEDALYLIVLAIELSKTPGFARVFLEELHFFDQTFRDLCISLLAEYFYDLDEEESVYVSSSTLMRSEENMKLVRALITDETVTYMLRISNPAKARRILPEGLKHKAEASEIKAIRRQDFDPGIEDRTQFFKDFCLLGSPSITHFLTYLEEFKDYFYLSREEQRLFLSIFYTTFREKESFRHIVLEKMVKFKVLDVELVKEPELGSCAVPL
jgi:hypothetical protein